jgi:hypothetical protein
VCDYRIILQTLAKGLDRDVRFTGVVGVEKTRSAWYSCVWL